MILLKNPNIVDPNELEVDDIRIFGYPELIDQIKPFNLLQTVLESDKVYYDYKFIDNNTFQIKIDDILDPLCIQKSHPDPNLAREIAAQAVLKILFPNLKTWTKIVETYLSIEDSYSCEPSLNEFSGEI